MVVPSSRVRSELPVKQMAPVPPPPSTDDAPIVFMDAALKSRVNGGVGALVGFVVGCKMMNGFVWLWSAKKKSKKAEEKKRRALPWSSAGG